MFLGARPALFTKSYGVIRRLEFGSEGRGTNCGFSSFIPAKSFSFE